MEGRVIEVETSDGRRFRLGDRVLLSGVGYHGTIISLESPDHIGVEWDLLHDRRDATMRAVDLEKLVEERDMRIESVIVKTPPHRRMVYCQRSGGFNYRECFCDLGPECALEQDEKNGRGICPECKEEADQ